MTMMIMRRMKEEPSCSESSSCASSHLEDEGHNQDFNHHRHGPSSSSNKSKTAPSRSSVETTDQFVPPTTSGGSSSSDDPLAIQERQTVKRSKVGVLVVIFLSAAACAVAAYLYTSNEQQDDFETHFDDVAHEVIALAEQEALTTFGVLESLATTVSSYALLFGQSTEQEVLQSQNASRANATVSTTVTTAWPNVTVAHWQHRGQRHNRLARALQISLVPLVRDLTAWNAYAQSNQQWIAEGLATANSDTDNETIATVAPPISSYVTAWTKPGSTTTTTTTPIDKNNDDEFNDSTSKLGPSSDALLAALHPQTGPGIDYGQYPYAPVWQQAPAPVADTTVINFDLLSHPVFDRIFHGLWETGLPVLSEVTDLAFLYQGVPGILETDNITHPHSALLYPVTRTLVDQQDEFTTTTTNNNNSPNPNEPLATRPVDRDDVVAFFTAVLPWDWFWEDLLPSNVRGVVLVLHNSCGEHYTYVLNGPHAEYLGSGDLHDRRYNAMQLDTDFAAFLQHNFSATKEHCEYDIRLYPSQQFEDDAKGWRYRPLLYAGIVGCIFSFTAFVFVAYDILVQRRQRRVAAKAKRSNAVVASLFPSAVRDRILQDAEDALLQRRKEANNNNADDDNSNSNSKNQSEARRRAFSNSRSMRFSLWKDEPALAEVQPFSSKPIAELYPVATVLFADIAGFTAWSSIREPSQVFSLLEAIYHSFDTIAGQRSIFKVETIGDCYVAVAGVPHARKDHAVVMARFGRDCITKMNQVVKAMELVLGPGTGDLGIRVGLHSGPVTAGVLRGEKARFQLFGDTVNTASRMEAMGQPNRVQVSEDTAKYLRAAKKDHWLEQRPDLIHPKGKGKMQTYWLTHRLRSRPPSATSRSGSVEELSLLLADEFPSFSEQMSLDQQTKRLVRWNTELMWRLIQEVVSHRQLTKQEKAEAAKTNMESLWYQTRTIGKPSSLLGEVSDTIDLPYLHQCDESNGADMEAVEENVKSQLFHFVSSIARLYRNNHFHNFQHASHVTMSVTKLLSRILSAPVTEQSAHGSSVGALIHEQTYGIASDPLTRFACVFAALVHDVDHTGLPNSQLIKEESPLASLYENKSIAEQNSFHVAWDLLMTDEYTDLRRVLCETKGELTRFRQLVVNSVMATDVVDKDLVAVRNKRWEFAFSVGEGCEASEKARWNRRATIVLDHLIQASDVSHTMQHWHVYRKWNELLFQEMYLAYKQGHAERDPASFWYQGELGFLDFYVIPLAKKLKDCGVFGVSSDEYLDYAVNNRQEWADKGKEVVAGMVEKYYEKDGASPQLC